MFTTWFYVLYTQIDCLDQFSGSGVKELSYATKFNIISLKFPVKSIFARVIHLC